MNIIIERFNKIKSSISEIKPKKKVNIVAISKTFPLEHIKPLLDHGHDHFGENKVQEAVVKWNEIKKTNEHLKLHMVGKLQSNKAKNAVEIFEYIHSLDNQKLADILYKSQKNLNKSLKYFIQVNIGNEVQKGGIDPSNLKNFYDKCISNFGLNIIGLMCIPPQTDVTIHFDKMQKLNQILGLKELSMGMSADYLEAIQRGSSFVRIGSKIFGERN